MCIKNYLGAVLLALGMVAPANAYLVAPAVSLEKMTEMADTVVKAKVLSETSVAKDTWFTPVRGFIVVDTKLQVISTIKGAKGKRTISFRHYAPDPAFTSGMIYEPQFYRFLPRRSYIVFSNKMESPEKFRQLWQRHTTKSDEGTLLAADDTPAVPGTVKKVFWKELTRLLNSRSSDDVIYALHQLDEMSAGGDMGLSTFDRSEVARVIRPVLSLSNDVIRQAAIGVIGSRNPYANSDFATGWLATVGKGHLPGLGAWNPKSENKMGKLLFRELTQIADSHAPEATHASVILALGRVGIPEVHMAAQRWTRDTEPAVRRAAVILLADFPDKNDEARIREATSDPSPQVRSGAALSIGFAQRAALVPLLGKLLEDQQPEVRDAAAMSLLSFSLDLSQELLHAHRNDPEYRSIFVNALAVGNAAPYRTDLEEIIRKRLIPSRFRGGKTPVGDSWDILFAYMQSRTAGELRSDEGKASLDALESMEWYSSSEPRDLYALYLQKRLTDRARSFRARCQKEITYDIGYYFDMVDKSPTTYQRN